MSYEIKLLDLLFGSYRQRALGLLLLQPDERFHVRELVMDILKHGPAVEVLAPAILRERVIGQLQEAAALYRAAS